MNHYFLMLKFSFLFISIGIITIQSAYSVTLREAFESALNHERVLIQESRINQFDERVKQSKSRILPRVNARGSYNVQQDAPIFDAPTVDRSRKSMQVELVQPLFEGFSEFAAIRFAEGQRLAELAELERTKIETFSELYEVFFSIKTIEEDIENIEELFRLSQERVNFISRRVDIGRSRESELISARAQKMGVRSQLQGARLQLVSYRERFYRLTGLDQDSEIEIEGQNFSSNQSMDDFLEKALSSSWVAPEKLRFDSSKEQIAIARAGHFPSFDVRANYYPYREGSFEDVKWDVTLNMSIPLYQGGEVQSRLREAVEQKREAELNYRLQLENIRQNVRTAYQSLVKGREQVSDYQQAVELNRENYELLQREYSLGLVSNLDVLQSLNQYIQSRRDLSNLRLENSQHYYELMALTGEIF